MLRLVLIALLLAAPALAQTPPPRRAELDGLLDQLKRAPSAQASAQLEAKIEQIWALQGGPTAALLLDRAARETQKNDAQDALDDINAALTLSPDYAEGLVRRATVRAGVGDYRGALADIEAALKLEPRHFGAFKALSRIAEDHGDAEGALRAWERALEIAPRTPFGADRLIELRKKVEGEGA